MCNKKILKNLKIFLSLSLTLLSENDPSKSVSGHNFGEKDDFLDGSFSDKRVRL